MIQSSQVHSHCCAFPSCKIETCILFFFLSFCHFLGPLLQHMEVPRLGPNQSYSHRPTPEPQQRKIQASSATYTTVHGNARSLTHWARKGIEPTTSWLLVRFVNHWATTGTPRDRFLPVSSEGRRKGLKISLGVSFTGTNPILEVPTVVRNHSPKPHLLTSSHIWLGFNVNLGEHKHSVQNTWEGLSFVDLSKAYLKS